LDLEAIGYGDIGLAENPLILLNRNHGGCIRRLTPACLMEYSTQGYHQRHRQPRYNPTLAENSRTTEQHKNYFKKGMLSFMSKP
jgi:hypothetical protein